MQVSILRLRECGGCSLKAYTDPPVRDELAWVKLDMTVCMVGHSWCSPLFTADDKVYTSHDTYLFNRLWRSTVIAAVRPIV